MLRKTILDILLRRKPCWRAVLEYAHFVRLRAEIACELRRAAGRGHRLPAELQARLRHEPHRWEDKVQALRFLDPGDRVLVLDVGGHRGQWLEDLLEVVPVEAVLAFEPVSALHEAYRARAAERAARASGGAPVVRALHVALSDHAGTARMRIDEAGFGSSLEQYREGVRDFVAAREEEVELATLDDIYRREAPTLPPVDKRLLKVDTQGHEVRVLRGAAETLRLVDAALVECSFVRQFEGQDPSFAEVTALLREAGLVPVLFRDYGREPGPHAMERDVWFVRREQSERILGWT